ncbi:hypothetical protein, partial [Gluconobacter cerinus]
MKIELDEFMLKLNKKPFKRELRLIAKEIKQKTIALLKQSQPSGERRGSHTASAPGQAPALIDGLLANSITYKVKGNKVTITDGAYYSKFLEVGAKGTGKSKSGTILERPFMSKVIDEMRDEITARLTK